MNKKEMFDSVLEMETQIGDLYIRLGQLKRQLDDLLKENNILKVENEHLRERLIQVNRPAGEEGSSFAEKTGPNLSGESSAHRNLVKLYQEGFHICNDQFGRPRKGEDCLFCMPFLYKKQKPLT